MADRSIIVRLMAEVGGFVSGMGKARRASEELGKSTQETGKTQENAWKRMTRSARENSEAWTSAGLNLDPPLMVPDGGWWRFGVGGCGYRGGGRA